MTILLILTALALVGAVVLWPRPASAHCDTDDGPAVTAGRRALETGNVNHAVIWVPEEAEAELRTVFAHVTAVRGINDDVAHVADRLFLETLVRLHRAGEGAPFDGLKPAGTTDPVVVAADQAIAVGRVEPLTGLVEPDQVPELERRLAAALALRDFDADDVPAGRRYLAAYVAFVKLAEGHEHEHEHEHGAAAGHGAGGHGAPAHGAPAHTCGHDAAHAHAVAHAHAHDAAHARDAAHGYVHAAAHAFAHARDAAHAH